MPEYATVEQAIAIGLSKARRAGVKIPKKGKAAARSRGVPARVRRRTARQSNGRPAIRGGT